MQGLLSETTGLVTFVRTVQTGSFSAAAKSLGATPSSASKSVSRLEVLLGAKLFRRSTRILTLTPEGEAFYEKVMPLLQEIESSTDVVQSHGATFGHLRISLPGEMGRLLVGSIFSGFMQTYPGISLEIGMTDSHVDILRDNYDIAFRVGHANHNGLMSRTLAHLDMVLVAAPSLIERYGNVEVVEDLRELPFARYSVRGRPYPVRFADGLEVHPRGRLDLDSATAIIEAAKRGLGAAHVLKRIVQDDIDNGSLVIVLPGCKLESLPFRALHAFGRMPNLRMQLLTDFVAATIRRSH
ncbi:LysR family transcriptional regulator [Neorhizobium sp. T25_27]|uniref:LysR family transcriptional regulator n=1 Tax=Neorhizobium sp. T25_27 TaxID=2093831 RepID=UPI000CF8E81A|nr:LysR family transcriptional regulator [Neorhizobium sp. T25_27]